MQRSTIWIIGGGNLLKFVINNNVLSNFVFTSLIYCFHLYHLLLSPFNCESLDDPMQGMAILLIKFENLNANKISKEINQVIHGFMVKHRVFPFKNGLHLWMDEKEKVHQQLPFHLSFGAAKNINQISFFLLMSGKYSRGWEWNLPVTTRSDLESKQTTADCVWLFAESLNHHQNTANKKTHISPFASGRLPPELQKINCPNYVTDRNTNSFVGGGHQVWHICTCNYKLMLISDSHTL